MANNKKQVDNTVAEVDGAISKSELWLEKNQKNIMYALIAIVLVVAVKVIFVGFFAAASAGILVPAIAITATSAIITAAIFFI